MSVDDAIPNSAELDSIYQEFDAADGKAPAAKTEEKAKVPEEKAGPAEKEKPAEQKPDDAKDDQPPVKAKELRGAYDALKQRVKTELEPQLEQLKRENTELKARKPETPKEVLTELETAKKRIADLERDLEFVDFQKSPKFVADYQKPYEDAWKKAAKVLAEFEVTGEDGNARPAKVEDLAALCQMNPRLARQAAKQMFGDDAEEVLAHRRSILETSERRDAAIADARTKSEERNRQKLVEQQTSQSKVAEQWKAANDELVKKFPKWFAPVEGDEPRNKALAEGYALADRGFSANGDIPMEERIRIHAIMRNRTAAFIPMAMLAKQRGERIAQLEKELAEYEKSGTPPARAGAKKEGKSKGFLEETFDELDSIERRAAA